MTFSLPDIDLNSWTDYQKQELERQLSEKVQGFGLNEMLNEKVAGLQEVVGQINPFDQPEPQPEVAALPPPTVVTPPEPPPAPMPPPETAPVAVSPPPSLPPPVQQAGPSPLDSALQAVQQAGGDVGAFIDAFNSGTGDQGARARAALQQAIRPPPPTPAVRPDLVPPVSRPLEPPSRGMGPAPTPAGAVNPNPTPAEVRAYITDSARARGIDPNIALKVANSEGGFEAARRGTFKTGSSWWPFQLHYGGPGYEQLGNVAGMGNQFTKETGYQPGDPNAWQAATDYALDKARQGGWGAWYGAKAQGIEGFQGIDRSTATNLGQGADISRPQVRDVSQFGDTELSAGDAAAACGPAAAVRFAQRFGRNPTLSEAVNLARTVGWTQQQGMAGIASEKSLMEKLGVPVELVMGRNWARVTQEAQTGNPVTVSTSKHYFTIDDYDPKTGKYHVGASGTDLRGGSDWMSSGQMEAALGGGAMQGALVADNLTVATQSMAGMESNPLDWVGRQKDSAIQQIQQLGGGVNAAFGEAVREPVEQKPVSTLGTREEDLGDIVVRQLDQAIDQTGEFFSGLGTDVRRQQQEAQALNPYIAQTPGGGFFDPGTAITAGLERAGVPGHEEFGFATPKAQVGPLELGLEVGPRELAGFASGLLPSGGLPARAAKEIAEAAAPEVGEAAIRAARSRLPAEAEAGFAAGMPTGGRPSGIGSITPDASPGVVSAADDADKIIAQRQAVSRGELPTDPTPEDVNRVLNGVAAAAENVGDRRARLKALETYLENKRGTPLGEDEKVWMRARVYEGRQDAALARLEADVSPALRQVPVEDRVYLDSFLEQMDNVDKAAASGRTFGAEAQAKRQFSGGARAQDEDAVREAWRQRLGDERFGTLETAAEAVWRTGDRIRDRLTQAGVYDEDMSQFFKDNFPHYVRTNILEHWSDDAIDALPRGAKSFSVGSDGVKRLTEAGTEKARQAPTSALVDMAFRAEELAQRNEIMRTMAGWADQPGMEMFVKKLEGDAPAPRGYMAVSYMDGPNGKQRLAVPDELKDALNLSKPNLGLAGIMMNAASFPLRAGATALRPAFIAFNMTNDLLWSLYRFAVEAPDPVEGARAMKDLARGYRAAFGGDPGLVQRSREAGGTIGGIRTRYENPDVIARELAGEHVWVRPIRTSKDFQTLLKDGWGATTDVAGLLWSRPLNMVGKPIEEAPRLGAFARAERLGLSPTEAAMAKRTQTADFDAGGLFVKQANNLIPFLNATTQATTEFTALSKKHPVKSAAAQAVIMSAIISTEIYNRAVAPEEYKDVSRHTRDHGLVLMSDKPAQGDGKRGLAFIPLRGGIGALVPLVREAMGRMYGDDPRTWQRLALEVLGTLSPVEPDLTGGGLAQLMPPPLKLGTELLTNYDIFRDQPIVSESLQGLPPSEQYTERTSQAARMLSRSGLPGVGGKPAAAIDYAVRGFSPGPGEALLGAADELITRSGNALPERPAKGEPGARDLPVVGGIVGRFLRTAGEERRTEAYAQAEQIMERNRQQTLDSVQQSEVYKAATPDRQQQMLRALEDELQQGAFDIAGVEPKDRDLGLPEKYVGVTDRKLERDIDEARSAYDAWKSDPGRAPMPTDEQIVLALSQGKALNPLHRIESKFDEEENAEIRRQVQQALAAERAKRQKR